MSVDDRCREQYPRSVLSAFLPMVLVVLCLPILIGRALTPLSVAAVDLVRHEPEEAGILMVGNSMVDSRINFDLLESLIGVPVAVRVAYGSRSAAWYLMLRDHVDSAQEPAELAVIFFRDDELTRPLARTEGTYRRQLQALARDGDDVLRSVLARNRDPHETVRAHLDAAYSLAGLRDRARDLVNWLAGALVVVGSGDISAGRTGEGTPGVSAGLAPRLDWEALDGAVAALRDDVGERFSYSHWRVEAQRRAVADDRRAPISFPDPPERTFIGPILELAETSGIRLVFVRVNRRADLHAARTGTDPYATYVADLGEWLENRGHLLLSMVGDPELTVDHFVDDEGHLHPRFKDDFTRHFVDRLRSLLASRSEFALAGDAVP